MSVTPPTNVLLTEHAVDRFHERVKPTLSRSAAAKELERLLVIGELRAQLPWGDKALTAHDAYLLLADGIVLALRRHVGQRWIALTCLTRGGASVERRDAKRESRRRKSAWRRHNAENKGGRLGRLRKQALES